MKNTNVKSFKVVALLLLCALLALTSCSAVFDSAISGTVKDRSAKETSSTSSGGIADVMVYAYDDANVWENAYKNWDGKSIFSDLSVPSAKTAADGSFSISSLRWKTNKPAYGKDADSRTIYLLAFHKDYGLTKVDGRTVQSDKSNNFGIVYCDKISASKNLVIKFKDVEDNSTTATGSDSTITDTSGFSYRYSYCDGYSEDGSDNVFATVSSITNGQSTITVKYKDDDSNPPTVTVYDIQTGDDWTYTGEDTVKMTYSEDSKTYTSNSLYFTNDWNTVTVTVNLKDGATNSSVTDPITFTWSYNNGDGNTVKTDTVTTSSGSATINVKFRKNMPTTAPCTLTLSKFDNQEGADDYWIWTEGKDDATSRDVNTSKVEVSLNNDSDSPSQDIYFKKQYLKLGTGISGYIYTSTAAGEGYGDKTDDGKTIILYKGSDKIGNKAITGKENPTTDSAPTNHGKFAGLGANAKLELLKFNYSTSGSYISDPIELTLKWADGSTIDTVQYTSEDTDFQYYKGL